MTAIEHDRLARGRAMIEESPGSLRVRVPAKRNWFVIVFSSAWLVGWAFGEVMVVGALLGLGDAFEDVSDGGTIFLLAWLTGWTVGGGAVLFVVSWMLAGREEISVEAGRLVVAKAVGPFRREKSFDALRVEDVRADPEGVSIFDPRAQWRAFGIGGGAVAFDYGARTHRFAAALDEAEAKQVARLVGEAVR